jgi:hypothetical protein
MLRPAVPRPPELLAAADALGDLVAVKKIGGFAMNAVVTPSTLPSFAYLNDKKINGKPKGLVFEFIGLGGMPRFSEDTPRGIFVAEHDILFCVPYLDPWNWMNPFAVRETDAILGAIEEKFGVTDLPFVSSGGSMGGLSCLVYACRARRKPVAVVANCPVCDLPYHYTERPDLPRTLCAAFETTDAEELSARMKKSSPLHLALSREIPPIPCSIFHCTADEAVDKKKHSDRLVDALRRYMPVDYYAVPDRRHCDLGEEMQAKYEACILNAFPDRTA